MKEIWSWETETYFFILHININRIGKLLHRITQIILQVALLAFSAPLLICLLLDSSIMELLRTTVSPYCQTQTINQTYSLVYHTKVILCHGT